MNTRLGNQINPKIYYLVGALRDGCLTNQKTIKFKQKNKEWLSETLIPLFFEIFNRKIKNNIYNEKKQSVVWCLAFKDKKIWNELKEAVERPPKTNEEVLYYIMGFWDTDGGCPREPSPNKKIYIKFTQKDKNSLDQLREMIESFEIKCGKTRVSEIGKNGTIWRFSITNRDGMYKFCNIIGSFHPEKGQRLIMIKKLLSAR